MQSRGSARAGKGHAKHSRTTRRSKATRTASKGGAKDGKHRWSAHVMETSDALDLEKGVFTKRSARSIALSLKRSADASRRRKADAFRSAMSMLSFHINRGGKNLTAERRATLNAAKSELRAVFNRPQPRHP